MPQPVWYVDEHIVRSLVVAFAESGHRACSSYNPVALDNELQSLPARDGRIPFNDVANVLSRHECHKLTGGCNAWTKWMRHIIREMKYLPQEVTNGQGQ